MILISFLLICLFIYWIVRKLTFQSPIHFFLALFILFCSNIVLSFEVSSLLGTLGSPAALLIIQAVLAAVTGVFSHFYKRGFSNPLPDFKALLKRAADFAGRHKWLVAFFVLIVIAYGFTAYISTIFPQNTSDALYNHLSRIGHWMQQDSLKPYESFISIGSSFPLNNSLLMMWSVLLAKTDRWVGLVQWFASIALALSICGLAKLLSFKNSQALFAGLLFLTFPIILFESTTAQNDTLAAAFLLAGFYLMIDGFIKKNYGNLILAAVSVGLAVGTKQYVLFAFPGAALFLIYFFLKDRLSRKWILNFCLAVIGFSLLLGSYAYIQNLITWKNPMGPETILQQLSGEQKSNSIQKLGANSARLITQFISCEGLPTSLETRCLSLKGKVFRQVFASVQPGLEEKVYLLEPNCTDLCFSFSTKYPYNEESAWYGWISWLVMIPAVSIGLINGIRKRKPISVLLILTGLIFFLLTSIVKAGWDPYQGRYLIFSTAVLMPFAAVVYPSAARHGISVRKILSVLVGLMSLFTLYYSIAVNDARNLVSTETVRDLLNSGGEPLLDPVNTYRVESQFRNSPSYFDLEYELIQTFYQRDMFIPLSLVNQVVPGDAHLGIFSNEQYFYDYYFFGDHLTREVYDITNPGESAHVEEDINLHGLNYLLVSPNMNPALPSDAKLIAIFEGWEIYSIER